MGRRTAISCERDPSAQACPGLHAAGRSTRPPTSRPGGTPRRAGVGPLVAHRGHEQVVAELVLRTGKSHTARSLGNPKHSARIMGRPVRHRHVRPGAARYRQQPLAEHGEAPIQRRAPVRRHGCSRRSTACGRVRAPAVGIGQVAGELAVVLHDRAQRRHRRRRGRTARPSAAPRRTRRGPTPRTPRR